MSGRVMSFDNRAQITCPVFKTTVELRGCFKIHERFMRGQKLETRQGCQACMASSKCPTSHIARDLIRRPHEVDGLYAAEPGVVKLPTAILERIAPIQTIDIHTKRFEPTPRELELIAEANGMKVERMPEVAKPRKRASKKPEAEVDAVVIAAQTGDLAAALNRASQPR